MILQTGHDMHINNWKFMFALQEICTNCKRHICYSTYSCCITFMTRFSISTHINLQSTPKFNALQERDSVILQQVICYWRGWYLLRNFNKQVYGLQYSPSLLIVTNLATRFWCWIFYLTVWLACETHCNKLLFWHIQWLGSLYKASVLINRLRIGPETLLMWKCMCMIVKIG